MNQQENPMRQQGTGREQKTAPGEQGMIPSVQQKPIRGLLLWGQLQLQSRGMEPEPARLECELLLAHILGVKRHHLYLNDHGILAQDQTNTFTAMLERRLKGEPLQYILGTWEFMGLPFQVDPRVLIPRWETEWLVDTILKTIKGKKTNPRILDLGTGSGAIAVSLAYFLPEAVVTAADIQADALQVAKDNAALNGISDRIHFLHGDMFAPLFSSGHPLLSSGHRLKFDVIVSNPPYIPSEEIPSLMKDVRDYEPVTALDGGMDGLDFYRRIAADAWDYLDDNGFCAMEVGAGQSREIEGIFSDSGIPWQTPEIHKDPAGIERIVVFHKSRNDRFP